MPAPPDRTVPTVEVIRFYVIGDPAAQGSKSPVYNRDGTPKMRRGANGILVPVMRESSATKVTAWREAVALYAGNIWKRRPPLTGPVMVNTVYWLPRPSRARSGTIWRAATPDIEKIDRATRDALTRATMAYPVLYDDSLIVLGSHEKRCVEKGGETGAEIEITDMSNVEHSGYRMTIRAVLSPQITACPF